MPRQPKGRCSHCDHQATYSKQILEHLDSCPRLQALLDSKPRAGGDQTLYTVLVEADEHWLVLLVPAQATLDDVDKLLVHVWMCGCGHMSTMDIEGRQ
jgi:hypothetical protein